MIGFPLRSMIFVADSSATVPPAARTSGSFFTVGSRLAGIDGAVTWSPSNEKSGAFPLMYASVFAYDCVKIWSKARSIMSVSTNVPLTMATPSTIASAVRKARSFRPASPRSATRITSE